MMHPPECLVRLKAAHSNNSHFTLPHIGKLRGIKVDKTEPSGRRLSGAAAALLISMSMAFILRPSTVLGQDSGKRDYMKYCARCHGTDGKGAASQPKLLLTRSKPPDLTLISKQNGGVFPFQAVEDVVDGSKEFPSHERLDMPFWGVDLRNPGEESTPESEARVKARIDAIVRYVESLQQH